VQQRELELRQLERPSRIALASSRLVSMRSDPTVTRLPRRVIWLRATSAPSLARSTR
jgi:hypothetical protein